MPKQHLILNTKTSFVNQGENNEYKDTQLHLKEYIVIKNLR